MKRKRTLIWLPIVAILFTLLAACASSTPQAQPAAAPPGGQPAAAQPTAGSAAAQPAAGGKVIKIYASWPMQGTMIPEGTAMLNAAKMALNEVNSQVGGYTIQMVFVDDASPTTGSWDGQVESNNAQKAIADDQALVYFGTYNSGAAKISMPLTNQAGMAQITPANSYPGLTKTGYEAGEPGIYRPTGKVNYFRTFGADDLQGSAGAAWAKCLGFKKVYILDDRQVYGKGLADVFEKAAKQDGLTVLGHEGVESVNIDFRALLTKVKASGADLVYAGILSDSGGPQIAQQMDSLGLFKAGVKFMSDDAMYSEAVPKAVSPEVLNGNLYVTFGSPSLDQLPTKTGQNFVKNYRAKYNSDPIGWSIYSYNAMLVILDSIKRAAPQIDAAKDVAGKRAAVLTAMAATKDLEGVAGPITFDQNGDPTQALFSGFLFKDGKYAWQRNISGGMQCQQ